MTVVIVMPVAIASANLKVFLKQTSNYEVTFTYTYICSVGQI